MERKDENGLTTMPDDDADKNARTQQKTATEQESGTGGPPGATSSRGDLGAGE